MGRAFWCSFWKLATLKAYVDSACLQCPAVLRLRKHPPTKNTIFPQHHQPHSSSQYKAMLPSFHPPCVPALNVSHITESPSHMKSQTSTVTSHIYPEKWLWQSSAGSFQSTMLFLSMLKAVTFRLLTSDWLFWSLTHQKRLTVNWYHFSSLNHRAYELLVVRVKSGHI